MPAPDPTDEAIARLSALVAADSKPTLDEPAVIGLLERNRRRDSAGCAPDEAGWVETYAWTAAAAEGYLMKAGRVAGDADFQTQKMSVYAGRVHASLLAQASYFQGLADRARGGIRSVRLQSATAAAAAALEADG